jgi:hypothetical protein
MNALASAHDAAVQMIDTSIVRASARGLPHSQQKTVNGPVARRADQQDSCSRRISNGLPVQQALTAGEAHDNRLAGNLLSRLKSGTMLLADRGYDADWITALDAYRRAWAKFGEKVKAYAEQNISSVPPDGRYKNM